MKNSSESTSGMAIASLVIGIIGFVFGWVPLFGFLLGILAVVLGILALSGLRKKSEKGKAMAIVGIVLGALAALFGIIIFVGIALFVSEFDNFTGGFAGDCVSSNGTICAATFVEGNNLRILFAQNISSFIKLNSSKIDSSSGCIVISICPLLNVDCDKQELELKPNSAAYLTFDCPDNANAFSFNMEVTDEFSNSHRLSLNVTSASQETIVSQETTQE